MNPEIVLAQVDPSMLTGDAASSVARFGFSVLVAWYLLTKTTSAIKDVASELAKLREELASTKAEIGREVYETRQDVKELRESRDNSSRR